MTDITVSKAQEKVEIKIVRSEGSDGKISCMIVTEALTSNNSAATNAVEFEDYLPKQDKVEFQHGENEKIVSIMLVKDSNGQYNSNSKTANGNKTGEEDEEENENEETHDVIFKVKLEKAEPSQVKISKKNICFVTIVQNEEVQKEQDDHAKMIAYFLASKDPSWGQ